MQKLFLCIVFFLRIRGNQICLRLQKYLVYPEPSPVQLAQSSKSSFLCKDLIPLSLIESIDSDALTQVLQHQHSFTFFWI